MEKQQNRVELKSSARTEMPGARKIGPADPNERITVTVVLRRGSAPSAFPSVERLGATAPMERHHLSRENSRLNTALARTIFRRFAHLPSNMVCKLWRKAPSEGLCF